MTEVPHPLPDELVGIIAKRFQLLADPTRVKILDALRGGPARASELTATVGTSHQNVSKHLALLAEARVVEKAKRGSSITYEVIDPVVFELCELVCGGVRRQLEELGELLDTPGVRPPRS